MLNIAGKLDEISRVKKPVFAPTSRQCQESFAALASLVESYNRKKENPRNEKEKTNNKKTSYNLK